MELNANDDITIANAGAPGNFSPAGNHSYLFLIDRWPRTVLFVTISFVCDGRELMLPLTIHSQSRMLTMRRGGLCNGSHRESPAALARPPLLVGESKGVLK
jgi:hypothetical protein